MNSWKNYWHRSAVIIVIFLNFIVTASATIIAYKKTTTTLPPFVYLLWASYFFVLLTLLISHKKKNMQKAVLNAMVLVLAAIPVSGLAIPLSLIFRGLSPEIFKANLFVFLSLVALLFLLIRHERFNILEAVTKLSNYMGELHHTGWRSSFAKYLIFETTLFLSFVLITALYLS
jgi:hypothetical protein